MNFLFEMAPLWLTLLIVFVIVLMFVLALKAKNAELEDKRSWFKKQSDLSFNDLRICRANAENLSKRLEDRKFELDGKKRLVSNLKASLAENKVYIDKVEKDLADAISEHDVIVSYNNTHIEELEEKKKIILGLNKTIGKQSEEIAAQSKKNKSLQNQINGMYSSIPESYRKDEDGKTRGVEKCIVMMRESFSSSLSRLTVDNSNLNLDLKNRDEEIKLLKEELEKKTCFQKEK